MEYLSNQVLLPIYSCSYSMAGWVVHLTFGVQDGRYIGWLLLKIKEWMNKR
jgi:hypothetical protein